MIAGENFGCGSSREHAPWAILDFGIRCIIAPSFADIFYNNCFKNGILPVILPQTEVEKLMGQAQRGANSTISVNLEKESVTSSDGEEIEFKVNSFKRDCLLNGWDDIGLTMQVEEKIGNYERKTSMHPWLMPRGNIV